MEDLPPKVVSDIDMSLPYTYADYLQWNLEHHVELIRGKVFKMSPAPNTAHQRILGNLSGIIWSFLRDKTSQVFVAPFDVRIPGSVEGDDAIKTVVQPDICVICDHTKIDERGCLGAPDFVIEILSKSTSKKDLREKYDVYEEVGVKEYWVVYPEEEIVSVFLLNANGKYETTVPPYTNEDRICPVTLPGLEVDLKEVFGLV